jgi:hypothetical protein
MVMRQPPQDTPRLYNRKSPFTKAIATRYYDGALEGFLLHRDWLQSCVFRMLDWDRETDLRVYEIARVEVLEFVEDVALGGRDRRPTWPRWVLPSAMREQGERLVDECFERARAVATVTTDDLFGRISEWEPADDAPQSISMDRRRREGAG